MTLRKNNIVNKEDILKQYKHIYINYRENAVYGLDFDITLLEEEVDISRELPFPHKGRLIDQMHYIGTIEEWMTSLNK